MRNSGPDKPIVNVLSFDIEDYFHAAALKSAFGGQGWDSLPSRVEANTARLLDLLDEEGARATFFILGWVAERFPALVSRIASKGHEIACHGYSHELIYDQTPAVFRQETLKAKRMLEDLTGTQVAGYRAASFSITRRSLWALDILIEAGFTYDSSIFPVVHDRYGIPGAPRFPYQLCVASGATILEFPPSTLRVAGLSLPAGGGGYFRLLPYFYTQLTLKLLNAGEQRPLMFYLHPWEIDTGQPVGEVSWLTRIRHYRNVDLCESRLRRLIRSASFDTAASVLSIQSAGKIEEVPVSRFG